MTIAAILTPSERRQIGGRHAARYARAVQACAQHAISDEYDPRTAQRLDNAAREAAHRACEHGYRAPILDRLTRAYPELEEAEDGDE